MSNFVRYFEHISVDPPISRILYRLGYKKTQTILDEKQYTYVNQIISKAVHLCEPKGAFIRKPIIDRTKRDIQIPEGRFESESLAQLLKTSDEVVLMVSTVGKDIIDKIQHEIKTENGSDAVILDATASQMAEKTMAWIMEFVNKMIRREGKMLTRSRYSPGYGDLSLSQQKLFFEILKPERLDIQLTKSYMMIPEKSVTAICGIEKIIE